MKTLFEVASRQFSNEKEKLNEVEIACLRSLDAGEAADSYRGSKVSLEEVENRKSERSIRAALLCWLCQDGYAKERLKLTDLRLRGHRIEGDFKLPHTRIPFKISLLQCVLPSPLDLRNSWLSALDLSGSRTVRIDADDVKVDEDVRLAEGFSAKGPVCFMGAVIKGDFVCVHGHFNNHDDHHHTTKITGCQDCRGAKLHAYSLIVEKAKVEGSMHFCGGFTADGGVLIADTEVGVNLNCTKGTFSSRVRDTGMPGKITGRRLSCEADADGHNACAFNAEGTRVKGNLILNEVMVNGEARLTGARVDGDVESVKGKFRNHGANAIHGDRLKVLGNVYFSDGFEAEGKVRLPMAEIRRDLSFTDARLTHPKDEEALYCRGMSVSGTIYLMRTEVTHGFIDISGVNAGGNLDCTDASFLCSGKVALDAEGMKITRSIFLSSSQKLCEVVGAVNFSGSEVGMDLNCHNGHFTSNASGDAIVAATMTIHGGVMLNGPEFKAVGCITLANTKIDSYLSFSEASFEATVGKPAISATNVQVGGSIFMDKHFSANGGILLNGAVIGRDLICNDGSIRNEMEPALWAVQMKVTGSVEMKNFLSEGEIRINNSYIGGILKCSYASFTNHSGNKAEQELPEAGDKRYALQANGVHVTGSALFDGFHADGVVSFKNAEVGMNFTWKGVREPKKAILDLSSLKAGVLDDETSSWPVHLDMDYFEYQFLAEMSADSLKSRRTEWLKLPRHFTSQPYEHLAEVLQRSGYDVEAKNVFIEKNRRQKRLPVRWKLGARDKYRQTQRPERWLYLFLYDFLICYGYRPGRALVIGCVLIAVGSVLFHYGFKKDLMAPVKPRKESHLHQLAPIGTDRDLLYVKESKSLAYSFIYAVDTFLPLVDLQTADYWLPIAYPPKKQQPQPANAQPDHVPATAQYITAPTAGTEQPTEVSAKGATVTATTASTQPRPAEVTPGYGAKKDGTCEQKKESPEEKALVGDVLDMRGVVLCWYRWFLIGTGWVISTLLAASLGGIVRK